jgi:7-carboxy-7-deazaguanine synthase
MASKDRSLRIAEVFTSIQGEGIWAGVPSTFVRVSGCNLRCSWCDTPYASWNPEGETMSIDVLTEKLFPLSTRHVVLTGGEPMLFEETVELARRCRDRGYTITVETAGTVFRELPCDLMSISPKLSNSTPTDLRWAKKHERTRNEWTPLRRLIANYPYQLKFVVNPDEGKDIEEIEALLARIPEIDRSRILLMPEGRDAETLWRRARALVPVCLSHDWRLAPRLQIDLFGDKRGT